MIDLKLVDQWFEIEYKYGTPTNNTFAKMERGRAADSRVE